MPELPDNLNDWPRDPAALLGVGRDADPRTLRRAYAKLIRVHKPERDPAKFQRIRAAYETLLAAAESSTPLDHSALSPSPGTSRPHEPPVIDSTAESSQIDDAWAAACDGQVADAYRRLRRLHDDGHDAEDVFLRLYWLARLHRQLESGKPAARWLARGIARHGLTDRLAQTYLAETLLDHDEALSDRCAAAVVAPGPLPRRFGLLHARWEAAARAGRWQIVQADLNGQRDRVLDDPPGTWPRLMLAAYDYVAWLDDPAAARFADALRVNLQKGDDVHTDLDRDFERFELLCDLVGTLPRGPAAVNDLASLVHEAWIADFDRTRTLFFRHAARWHDVEAGLAELDALTSRSPPATTFLTQLGMTFAAHSTWSDESENEARRRGITASLAVRLAQASARKGVLARPRGEVARARLRSEIARFCADEAIGYNEFLEAAFADPAASPLPADLAPLLADDLPLRCLVEATHALLSAA